MSRLREGQGKAAGKPESLNVIEEAEEARESPYYKEFVLYIFY